MESLQPIAICRLLKQDETAPEALKQDVHADDILGSFVSLGSYRLDGFRV